MPSLKYSILLQTIIFNLILAILCPFASGKIIYVDDDATSVNVGSSWMYAINSLQDALLLANFYDKPVEIRVAQGIYKPDDGIGIMPGDRGASFELINRVTIRGGYAGLGNPDPNARDYAIYETILSGNIQNDDRKYNNSYHVVTSIGTDSSAILDGFIVTGGYDYRHERDPQSNSLYSIGHGAGMYNIAGSPTVYNCIFRDNHANAGGGGMFNNENSNPALTNCTFIGNNESAIFNIDSSLMLNDCIFTENKAGLGGGAIYNTRSSLALTNCVFGSNMAGHGGGIYNTFSNLTLNNCIFSGNVTTWGGGIANLDESQSVLLNCTFSTNYAFDSGGGIYNVRRGKLVIVNCIFSNNRRFEVVNGNGNTSIAYSNIQGGQSNIHDPWYDFIWGEGNIDIDPLFARVGYWADVNDTNVIVEPNDLNAVWINGDYHLKSQAGRWDPNSKNWVIDDVTSPCIDAGDPNSPVGNEPFSNGGIINMGAYGGTAEASKSPSGLHAKYGGGKGDPNNPYLIYTIGHLNALCAEPNDWDRCFKLMADINLSGHFYYHALIAPDIDDTEPGHQGTSFTGKFDGNGHMISQLTITGVSYLGLFGQMESGAELKNLGVVDVKITGSGNVVGGLVGNKSGIVFHCYSTGIVSGRFTIGGLVGSNISDLIQCYSCSSVSGEECVGGLVGGSGESKFGWGGSVTNCYSTGPVSGNYYVGGLVGWNYGTVAQCYSTGAVSGQEDFGGLVGTNYYGNVSLCFWDIQTSGLSTSDGGTGETTARMKTRNTFTNAGWDFMDETDNGIEDIWWILEGQDYPRLWWESVEE